MHAPIIISLAVGLIAGALAQRTRFCTVAGIRDSIMFKDFTMLIGFVCLIVVAAIANAAFGFFHVGFEGQPIAHNDGLWNFLGLALVGFCSVLLGGCPLRQLILSGEGNIDSVITVIGMVAGAAFCHSKRTDCSNYRIRGCYRNCSSKHFFQFKERSVNHDCRRKRLFMPSACTYD